MDPRRDLADLYARAVAALYRTERSTSQPDEALSGVEEHDSKVYVVLRNVRGVIAVYRVRNDQMLKRLKRLPGGIEQHTASAPQPPHKVQLTPEQIASLVPDDFGRDELPPDYPEEQRMAWIREQRESLAALPFAADSDPMPALRRLLAVQKAARSRPAVDDAWREVANAVDDAWREVAMVANGRAPAAGAAPRSAPRPAPARETAPARRPRSRARRSRRTGARVARTSSGDSDGPQPRGDWCRPSWIRDPRGHR